MARSTLDIRNPKITDRQDTGARLLQSSARMSYDPMVEVDWDAPSPTTCTASPPSGPRCTARRCGTR